MLTKEEARKLVEARLETVPLDSGDRLVVLDEHTIERPFGWVFFYSAERFVQTQDERLAIAGNAPYIVNRHTGELKATGTARSIESYIADYEAVHARGRA